MKKFNLNKSSQIVINTLKNLKKKYLIKEIHSLPAVKARAEFFKDNFPACSLVEVSKLAGPNIYVEIEGIAHIGKGPF